ncbi:NAD(P)-dependent oxidoreductase [Puia dinghuensis]|uniref:3-hydroxy acid dehydrogenase n=1 Tax=Puia dinghuensis TaxID=1792502 RepID=A0A8J2XTG1_9BACT|nr:NAD(P)-dependent oxidoreductase [Puia dinghuensis]GGB03765.1 3-hydroxy acid dehydrogenase [Puia dinghuensis]
MSKTNIGWIGLGTMGAPLAQRLLDAGHPVTGYNRSKEKEAALKAAGASIASTPAEALTNTDILFLMVSDDRAIWDVFSGDDGLLSAKASGKLIINMSTVSPAISRDFATVCREQGNEYLDAPVSGSVKQAQEGQLVIMVGGTAAAYAKATPVLELLGKLVLHIGDSGAGNTAKLAINLLLSFHAQGLAEAVIFAQHHGIKTEDFLTIMNNGALGNVFGKIKGDAILNDNYKPAFALKHIVKDLRLAKAEGWNTPLAEVAFQSFQEAQARFGEEDIIAIKKQLDG